MCDIRDSAIGKRALRAFQPAVESSPAQYLARTIAQSLAFWLIFLGLVPVGLAMVEREHLYGLYSFPTQNWSPWIVFALAGGVGLCSGATMALRGSGTPIPMAAPRRLVVAGPYRYVRNPMAVAGLLQGACVGVALGSSLSIAYVLAGGLLWDKLVRPLEELDLETRFGESYVHYRNCVRCWVPRARPYRPNDGRSPAA